MARGSKCCQFSWFVNDGIGIGCAIFTYLLIGYAEFVVVFVMLLPEVVSAAAFGMFHAIAFTVLACLALVAHSRAMCSDPVSSFLFVLYISEEITWLAELLLTSLYSVYIPSAGARRLANLNV